VVMVPRSPSPMGFRTHSCRFGAFAWYPLLWHVPTSFFSLGRSMLVFQIGKIPNPYLSVLRIGKSAVKTRETGRHSVGVTYHWDSGRSDFLLWNSSQSRLFTTQSTKHAGRSWCDGDVKNVVKERTEARKTGDWGLFAEKTQWFRILLKRWQWQEWYAPSLGSTSSCR
jgi:hypothetical protein